MEQNETNSIASGSVSHSVVAYSCHRAMYRAICGAMGLFLLLATPAVMAKVNDNTAENWSEWKSMGSGFVARIKVPAKFNMPKSERQLASVQEKKGLGRNNLNKGDSSPSSYALWLITQEQGLYGVSVTELAEQSGESQDDIRKSAAKGNVTITNVDEPVAWYFDAVSDRILFVGENYDTLYSKQNAYHFSAAGGKQAEQMQEISRKPGNSSGLETPFNEKLHFEEEPDMWFATGAVASEPDADYWFWDYLYNGYKDSIEIELTIPSPASGGTALLRVNMRGITNMHTGDEHHVYAELNGVAVGPVHSWDAFSEAILVAEFDQSLLNPSGNNTLQLSSAYADSGKVSVQYLNEIDIEYQRLPVAVDDKLWLHNVAAGTQTVSGFSGDNILVFESPGSSAALRTDVNITTDISGNYSVSFNTKADVDYLVVEQSAISASAVGIDEPSSLQNRKNAADYLIIAASEFESTARALAEYRSIRFDTEVVWLDDIYDEFSGGREDPFAITRFVNSMQQNWRTAPSVIMLLGKGTVDHKDRMGYGDSFLPVVFTNTPWALAASDDRLLGGNGDAAYVFGRLPITNDDEGLAYVDKLIDHESSLAGDELYQAVLVADNPDAAGDFHINSDLLAERLTFDLGFNGVTKLYHPMSPSVRSQLILDITWESGYVSYDGHGSATQIGNKSSENFIKATDADALSNFTYPIFTALTCAAGDHSWPGVRSLTGALVLNPVGGAIASMAPTGLSLDYDAQLLSNAFVGSLYSDTNTIGDAVKVAKMQTQGNIHSFMQRMYAVIGDPVVYGR